MLRFSRVGSDYWKIPGNSTGPSRGASTVNLQLKRSSNPGYASTLPLDGGNGLYLFVFEETGDLKRTLTRGLLKAVNTELRQVLAHRAEVAANGCVESIAPPESVERTGESRLTIEEGLAGTYQVMGYVNPGQSGYTYLKAFNARTGARLSPQEVSRSSVEYSGWTKSRKPLFFVNSQVSLSEKAPESGYPARFELWFVPDDHQPETKLAEGTRRQSRCSTCGQRC